jgi:hypothetical protein
MVSFWLPMVVSLLMFLPQALPAPRGINSDIIWQGHGLLRNGIMLQPIDLESWKLLFELNQVAHITNK